MNLYTVLLNNQISLTLVENNNIANTIFCNSFNEHLFNISVLQTREKEIILEHTTIKDRKFATVDLLFEDGTCFKNVTFEIVVNEGASELPYCSFNKTLLENTEIEKLDPPKNREEFIVESVAEEPTPQNEPLINIEEEFKQIVDRKKKLDEATNKALLQEAELVKQKEQLEKEKIALEKSNIITSRVEEYKLELVKEFFDAIKKQEELINLKVDGNYEKLEEKVVSALERYRTQFLEQVDEVKSENIEQIQASLEATIERQRKEIHDLLENEFNDNREAVTATLFEKSVELEKLLLDKVVLNLESYKQLIYKEFNSLSKTNINNAIDTKLKKFSQDAEKDINSIKESFKTDLKKEITNAQDTLNNIVDIFEEKLPAITEILKTDKRLKDLLEDRKELAKNKENLKKDIVDELKEYCNTTVITYARRILDLGSGGGSVAVQYANGGTMNGNLNVNGSYLSGGVDLLNIFSGGGLTDRLINGSYQVVLSSNGDLTFPGGGYIGSQYGADGWFVTPPAQGGIASADGQQYIQINNGQGIFIGTGWPDNSHEWTFGTDGTTLFPNQAIDGGTAPIELKSRSWSQLTYNNIDMTPAPNKNHSTTFFVEGGDALLEIFRWDNSSVLQHRQWTFSSDGSLTFPDNTIQATAFTGANIAYTNQNTVFEKNVTIQGNLTALGTSTFQNTIFTTTSALSVVNLGPGPALYVFQAAGPYDVASFYDGDGIEVLHVGNAQPGGGGFVGINESHPSAALTVNGNISGNGSIVVNGGNSNNWNSAYTTVNANSASWEETLDIIPTVTNYLSANNVLLSAAKIADDLNVAGTGYFSHIAAATKSFYIVHPTDNTKHLQYGSLESPYHGVRLTGKDTIAKECSILLPPYIKDLVKEDNVNVQLTNINHTQTLFVKKIDISNNTIIIGRNYNLLNQNKSYEFYWSFTAVRKDIPDLKTVL